MPGSGHAPPRSQPSPAVLVALRVLFTVCALCSCGLLTWAAPLRIAILRKRAADWVVFSTVLVLGYTLLAIVGLYGAPPSDDSAAPAEFNTVDTVGVLALAVLSVGVATYFLIADITHYRTPRPQPHAWGPVSAVPQHRPFPPAQHPEQPGPYDRPTVPDGAPGPAYGYPAAPPKQPEPHSHPQPSPPQSRPQHSAPQPGPPTRQPLPSAPRIDQVRAELDELSELLRREPGYRDSRNRKGESGRDGGSGRNGEDGRNGESGRDGEDRRNGEGGRAW
ncbi:hypothetical protein [Streptomyces candidus]|uniref:Integral membrane protein n=1 Tax=Streptomyces candidus TaxID=67283 RepID=A0A7X0HD44_9ACTN|nr:hypothetical protein [Streptomyces candidus]MBB6435408.1 hypothetical protein [Streptomyces candidus]GHH47599.1 hypothetical protein GCM10018773_40460 [Streptomyces candidus]